MKKKYSVLGGLLLSLLLVGTSWATPCPCVDGDIEMTWVEDIDIGGDGETDTIVELFFLHSDSYDRSLVATGAWWNNGLYSDKDGDIELATEWSWINDLNTYGTLGGKILALPKWYDYFKFNQSILTADDHESILEPATMLLLGTGIAGLAGWRRKAKKYSLGEDGE